mmetsp:Transcript_32330/g.49161  ORF Transcript_32330/g.49161 Transcript_32330/m.49161 type:complete len:531 (+) Transcript_32330:31-1623(+)
MSHSRLTLSLAQHLLSSGRVTRQELVLYSRSLAVAGEEIYGLNAFSRLFSEDECLDQIDIHDGDLAGIPISIKANLAVRNSALTASSAILASEGRNCGYNADVVEKLQQNGAVIMGITQMDEFGMGSLGTNLGEGKLPFTRNPMPFLAFTNRTVDEWVGEIQKPHDLILEDHHEVFAKGSHDILLPGGSSCGSAASVSHGSSLISIASDTGGSIRLPAAWCGVTGFKPLYGTISRKGLVSYASSLDTVGIIANTASCISSVLPKIMAQANDQDKATITDSTARYHTTSMKYPYDESETIDLTNLIVGIPSAFVVEECPAFIHEAWAQTATALQDQCGATVSTLDNDILSPELIRVSLAAYYILASAEASSNLSRYNGFTIGAKSTSKSASLPSLTELEKSLSSSRSAGFGPEVIRRILAGTYVLSSDRFHSHYEAAMTIRAVVYKQMRHALENADVLLIPTSLSLPPKKTDFTDPTAMFANDILTVPISLAGLPSISIPSFKNKSIGLQIVGSSNNQVLRVAMMLQQLEC